MPFLRLIFCILIVLVLPEPSLAQSTHSWTVAKVTGTAFIAQKGVKAQKVRRGMALHPGQTLSTRSRTRLLLTRGTERMQVGPGAVLAIPPARFNKRGKTLILHQSGRLDLSVDKRRVKHFAVKTPYLTAVVKGTTFTVDVREGRAQVDVHSGAVEVSDSSSGETTEITKGQSASVAKTGGKTSMTLNDAGKQIFVRKDKSKIAKPGFYATVKKNGKVMALKPGSIKNTAPVKDAKPTATQRPTRQPPQKQSSFLRIGSAKAAKAYQHKSQRAQKARGQDGGMGKSHREASQGDRCAKTGCS